MPDNTTPGETPPSRRAARQARESATAPEIMRAPAPEPQRFAQSSTPPRTTIPTRPAPLPGTAAVGAAAGAAPTGTLEDLFTGQTSVDEVGAPPPKKRRRRRVGGWIALIIVLAIVGGLAVGGVWAVNTFGEQIRGVFASDTVDDFEAGQATGEAQITIVEGDLGTQVSQKMFDAGVTKTATSLYDYMVQNAVAFTFQPGVFRLQQQMTSPAALEALRNPENRLQNRVQLPEGLTVADSIARMSEQTGLPLADFEAAVADPAAYGVPSDSLEGWLFPATYDFDPAATAADMVGIMVARAVESLDTAGVAPDDRQRVLTIASIIQREARAEQDFYRVSRVIENRLDPGNQETFGRLEMDSTAQYGAGEDDGTASTSEEAQFDDNPWNTYVRPGLPVGPIANPGDLAIQAALNPEEGPWLYFVTVNLDTGETVFTSTYAEHQQAIGQMLEWCRANPDSGC